jgi:hypothetical protein
MLSESSDPNKTTLSPSLFKCALIVYSTLTPYAAKVKCLLTTYNMFSVCMFGSEFDKVTVAP